MSSGNSGMNDGLPKIFGNETTIKTAIDSYNAIAGPEKMKYIIENKLLTACDIYKDAINTVTPINLKTSPLFTRIIETFFVPGGVVGWPRILARIEHERLDQPEKIQKIPISFLKPVFREGGKTKTKIPEGVTLAALPSYVSVAVHDSGYDPKEVNSNINRLLVHGSYFDPASRNKNPELYFTLPYEIPQKVLALKGFSDIVDSIKLRANNTINPSNVEIEILFRDFSGQQWIFTSVRDNSFKFVPGNTLVRPNGSNNKSGDFVDGVKSFATCDFFDGNNVKNTWFNIYGTAANVEDVNYQLAGILFVLCKELGDFLQGLCLYFSLGTNVKNAALFTVDKVLAARAIQDTTDVVLQEQVKNEDGVKLTNFFGFCSYYTYSIDPFAKLKAQKEAFLKNITDKNQILLNEINTLLTNKKYTMSGVATDGAITDEHATFLDNCIKIIKGREEIYKTMIANNDIDLDMAHQLATACLAIHFIGNSKIKYSVNKLFQKTKYDSMFEGNIDLILENKIKLGEFFKIQDVKGAKGGGRRRITRKQNKKRFVQKGGNVFDVRKDSPTYNVFETFVELLKDEDLADAFYSENLPMMFYFGMHILDPKLLAFTLENANVNSTLDNIREKIMGMNNYIQTSITLNNPLHYIYDIPSEDVLKSVEGEYKSIIKIMIEREKERLIEREKAWRQLRNKQYKLNSQIRIKNGFRKLQQNKNPQSITPRTSLFKQSRKIRNERLRNKLPLTNLNENLSNGLGGGKRKTRKHKTT